MAKVLQNALGDPWKRLQDSTTTFGDRLDKHAQAERKVFFRALIENLRSSLQRIPSLHFSPEPESENIRKRAPAELLKHEADDLRDEPAPRTEGVSGADDILAAMAGYCGDLGRAAA
jgi:hypothetical protein